MLRTSRCVLTEITQSDYEDVKELYLDNEVRRFLGGTREEGAIQGIMDEMLGSDKNIWYWIIREVHTREFIGLVSLDPHHIGNNMEVSYQFLPKWWGNGFATEAVSEIINFAFGRLDLPRVVAETQAVNVSSRKLLERLGMKLIDTYERFGAEQSLYSIESNKGNSMNKWRSLLIPFIAFVLIGCEPEAIGNPSGLVSIQQYNQLENNTEFNEVLETLGQPDFIDFKENTADKVEFEDEYTSYSWSGVAPDSVILLWFRDGRLYKKEQFGLE
ncbi:GNAT family N-acetyltransferase [Oceanobacillus massiliensis]|uniref:GNAT family N-acetyltransferase n=1 Tax=Oceanobacillus massiliensis TaxID=1465765 RepID=UPI000289246A|nr:GNAT family N-acetyltransferase [Oceanobacillus massiliensis]